MPNCMREGWGQAGIWNQPLHGSEQDRPYIPSKRAMTPRHGATRAAVPKNSLNVGGVATGTDPLSFKITLGGSLSAPLNAWTDESDTRAPELKASTTLSLTDKIVPMASPQMRPAGNGGVFFGDRPMWAASSDKKRKQMAYQAGKKLSSSQSSPISLRSPSELALLKGFSKAEPEVLTPASSRRPLSSAGSRRSNALFEVTANPNFKMSKLSTQSIGCPMVFCHGKGPAELQLMTLSGRRSNSSPSGLDALVRTLR